jgi:hypothetical protein
MESCYLSTMTAVPACRNRYNGYVFYNSPRVWIQPVTARFTGFFFSCLAWVKPAIVIGQSYRRHLRRVAYEALI